jgi:hypothetical protein
MLALKLLLALMSSASVDPSFPKDSPIAAAVDTPVELQLEGGDDKTVWSTSPEKLIIMRPASRRSNGRT